MSAVAAGAVPMHVVSPPGTWRLLFTRLRRRPVVAAALVGLVGLIMLAAAAPLVSPYDPYELIPGETLRPPTSRFFFGTDDLGRDIFSRVIYGTRISLQIGVVTVSIALILGTAVGLAAGYYGGRIDSGLMAVMEVMLAFPQILLAMGILAMLGPSLINAMIAVGLSAVPVYARTARSVTLGVKGMDYIEAARAVGAVDLRIVGRHVLPNMIPSIIVLATAGMGISLLVAAGLSYLGLGAQPPLPEWGSMLSAARAYLRNAWWIATFPGMAIMIVVLCLNICGDWLRDLLDPRLRA